MGIFDFLFKNKKNSELCSKWNLGDLKNLDDITLKDMQTNPIWVNDLSGEFEDDFDESSERPILNVTDVCSALFSQFASIAVLAEFPKENEIGSVNIEDVNNISCAAVWRNDEWIVGKKAFAGKENIEIKVIPSINGANNILFIYDPKSDSGKRI